jgi:centromeric protein E
VKLEEERRALAAFVTKFDSLGLGLTLPSKLQPPKPTLGGALTAYAERRQSKLTSSSLSDGLVDTTTIMHSNSTKPLNTPHKGNATITNITEDTSPIRPIQLKSHPRLLDQVMPEEADMSFDEFEVEQQLLNTSVWATPSVGNGNGKIVGGPGKTGTNAREVFGDKENILPVQA